LGVIAPETRRVAAGLLSEYPREMAGAREADLRCEIDDGGRGCGQNPLGRLDPTAIDELQRRQARGRAEGAVEMALGQAGQIRQRGDPDFAPEMAFDMVAHAVELPARQTPALLPLRRTGIAAPEIMRQRQGHRLAIGRVERPDLGMQALELAEQAEQEGVLAVAEGAHGAGLRRAQALK